MSTPSTVVEILERLDANIKTAASRNVKVEGQGIPWMEPVDGVPEEDVFVWLDKIDTVDDDVRDSVDRIREEFFNAASNGHTVVGVVKDISGVRADYLRSLIDSYFI